MKRLIAIIVVIIICIVIYLSIELVDPLFRTVITESEYNKLSIGMTYDQVTDIVGGEGHRTSSRVSEYGVREVYKYTAPNSLNNMGYGDIYITFLRGRVAFIELSGSF